MNLIQIAVQRFQKRFLLCATDRNDLPVHERVAVMDAVDKCKIDKIALVAAEKRQLAQRILHILHRSAGGIIAIRRMINELMPVDLHVAQRRAVNPFAALRGIDKQISFSLRVNLRIARERHSEKA